MLPVLLKINDWVPDSINNSWVEGIFKEILSLTWGFILKKTLLEVSPHCCNCASWKSKFVTKTFNSPSGETKTLEVELFTWEKLDMIDKIKSKLKL